jgi:tryptophan-rich sensory protein
MGVGAYRAWTFGGFQVQRFALSLFIVQLALNLAWPYIFFERKRIDEALQEILFLWVAIAATVVMFMRIDLIAGISLVPYLVWVSFAALLNSAIYQLNKKPKDTV